MSGWRDSAHTAALVFSFALVCARSFFLLLRSLSLCRSFSLAARFNSARRSQIASAPLLFHHHQYYLHRRTLLSYLCFIIAQRNSLRLPSIIFSSGLVCNSPFNLLQKAPPALLGASPNELSTHCQCDATSAFFSTTGKCLRLII